MSPYSTVVLAADLTEESTLLAERMKQIVGDSPCAVHIVLQQLPDDVLGVHFDKRFVAAFWMEKSPTTQDHKSPPLALFWPKRKSKAAQTPADFPRLQRLDATMRALVNASKKHWGVGSE